jgi:hypothetical protein
MADDLEASQPADTAAATATSAGGSDVSSSGHASKSPSDAQPSTSSASAAPLEPSSAMPSTATTTAHTTPKDAASSIAAPYGTRSRNRPAGSRPNYAEDVEMDFEMAPTSPKLASARHADPVSRSSDSPVLKETGQNTGKKSMGNANPGWAAVNASDSTSQIPGTSTFAAGPNGNTAGTVSKRRKAQATQPMSNGTHSSVATAPQTAHRRPHYSRETNMMTFERSQALLNKHGYLEADDGAVLKPNGKF